MAARVATDISLQLHTSGLEFDITAIGQPYSRQWESIDTTHLQTEDAMTFMPADLPDNGELNLEGHYDEEQSEPEASVAEYVTLTFGKTGEVRYFKAFWTEFTPALTVNERQTFSGTLKITGPISDVAGS